jgi:DNA anti-recombination protein RmuC
LRDVVKTQSTTPAKKLKWDNNRVVKNFVSISSITLFLLVLWQCNPMFERKDEKTVPVSTVKRDLEDEKKNLAEDLRDCSDNLDRRIDAIDRQINRADEDLKTSLKELRARLVKEKTKIDRSLKEIEQSSEQTWLKIKKKSGEVLTDAKIETQKIEERVEDLGD